MHLLISRSLAPSTIRSYNAAFRGYLQFCKTHNLKALPIFETNLMLFVTSISHHSISNVKIHICAVKHFATYYTGLSCSYYPRLYMLVRSIKRKTKKQPKRIPVTLPKLKTIYNHLSASSLVLHDKIMLWAAITTAFFGFLRSSEYVSTQTRRYDPASTLCFEDVTYKQPNILIHIKSSKTDPFREGCTICLSPSSADVCPVSNLLTYLNLHPTRSGPLFVYADKTLLTQRRLNTLLKDALPHENPVSTHSLRIGAATTAASAGMPRWLIQQLGRWVSDCFRSYIRIPQSTFLQVSNTLATTHNEGAAFDPDLA